MDPVAECDEAEDGTPCGLPGRDRICIYDACMKNTCGDGFRGRFEACDDGSEASGDGCSERCQLETCGDGKRDVGEACDDGNDVDEDACTKKCAPPGEVEVVVDVVEEEPTVCPVVTGIDALPLETTLGHDLQLVGYASSTGNVSYAWSGEGGAFGAPTHGATAFTCETADDHALAFTISRPDCDDSTMEVLVTCSDPGADAGL